MEREHVSQRDREDAEPTVLEILSFTTKPSQDSRSSYEKLQASKSSNLDNTMQKALHTLKDVR